MEQKIAELDRIRQDILDRNICPDLASSATKLVMGSGNVNARVLFVGEAPGKKEDELGLPFVGAAGKFLDKLLSSIDLNRDDVYITNIVKYRPPENRDPTSLEKAEFWPYLLRQIEIIKPDFVVTLGRHSMGYFLPKETIGEVHGRIVENDLYDFKIVPLFHPAAALYNGKLKQTLFDDFKILSDYIR